MTFLFDIGKVLLDFDFESSLAPLLPPDTPDRRTRFERLLARKDEFEKGLVPAADYIPWALGVMESSASITEFEEAWRSIFTPVTRMWQSVRQLSQSGHRLILFSNTNEIHMPWALREFEIFECFPHGVFSFEVQSIKPEPEIYLHAIERFSLVPAETLYVDDLQANIDTGIGLGMRCWQYDLDDHDAFESWLRSELQAPDK